MASIATWAQDPLAKEAYIQNTPGTENNFNTVKALA
jgi:hypothetical protein